MHNISKIMIFALALPFTSKTMEELKERQETKSTLAKKILAKRIHDYRSERLEQHLIKDLSNIVQEYIPYEYKWECESTIDNANIISAMCTLPNNKLAFTSNNKIKIWDLNADKCIAELAGHTEDINALCLLPRNKLASASHDLTIKIWDLDTYKLVTKLKGHNGHVYALCLLPGNKLASSSIDGTIKIWDLKNNKCIATLGEEDTHLGIALCFWSSLTGNFLASGSVDHTIKIWNINTNKCIVTLRGHTEAVTTLCLLPGNKLASGSEDGTIKIWNLINNKCIVTIQAHRQGITSLCLLPRNKLASACWLDGLITIWDLDLPVETLVKPGTIKSIDTLIEHIGGIKTLCLLPKSKLVSGSYDDTIKLWTNEAIVTDFPDRKFNEIMNKKESRENPWIKNPDKNLYSSLPNCIIS